jgi:hypothetical protein
MSTSIFAYRAANRFCGRSVLRTSIPSLRFIKTKKWRCTMTNLARFALVAAAVFAASTPALAQVRGEKPDQAYARAWEENGNRVLERRARSTKPGHDVYDGQRYLGSDPSMQIRSEILRDRENNQ